MSEAVAFYDAGKRRSGLSRSDPVKEPAGYFFKSLSIDRTQKVIGDAEKDSSGKSQNTGGDCHSAQRIKYCLPLIGSGKTHADASDYTDIRKDRGRKEQAEAKKNKAAAKPEETHTEQEEGDAA